MTALLGEGCLTASYNEMGSFYNDKGIEDVRDRGVEQKCGSLILRRLNCLADSTEEGTTGGSWIIKLWYRHYRKRA